MNKEQLYIGFQNGSDYLGSCFGLKAFQFNLVVSFLFALTTFISDYIYKAEAVYFMMFLLFLDFATGVWRAVKHKTFSSARLPRVFVILLTYCLLLSISTFTAEYSSYFSFLPGLMYGGIISTLLVSVWENLYRIGLLKKNLYDLIGDKLKIKKEE